MQQQRRRGQLVVNGYFVYTRRKRIEHDSDNEKAKRLKTEGNELVKVKIDKAVKNDVVLCTSKRQRRPSFMLKDGSGDKVAAARVVNNEEERCVCSMVFLLFTSVARRRLVSSSFHFSLILVCSML
jgi:hypothetical protein